MKKIDTLILVSLLIISVLLGGCNGSGTTAITNKKIKELIVYCDPEMSCQGGMSYFSKSTGISYTIYNTDEWFIKNKFNYFIIGGYSTDITNGIIYHRDQYAFFQFPLNSLTDNKINSKNLKSVKLLFHYCGKDVEPQQFGDLMVDMIDYKSLNDDILTLADNNLKKLEVDGVPTTNDFYYKADYSSEVKSLLDNKQQYIQFRLKHSIDYGQTKSNGSEYINNSKADDKYAPKLIIEYEVYN